MRALCVLAAALSLSPWSLSAQTVALGAGYSAPRPIDVAPGQVITLFVRVPGKPAADPVTATPPLPTSVGGFTVTLRQTFPSNPIPVPISAVRDATSCSGVVPDVCDPYSLITVQIPFALTPNVPRSRLPANFARLDIQYNDNPAASLALNPVPDSIHVTTSCDANENQPGVCLAYVTHADGRTVTRDNPAQVGELLTAALVGLGLPDASVTTGATTPGDAPAVSGVVIDFDPRPDASPSRPDPASARTPDSARLRPGALGLYEVTFTVPAMPANTGQCISESSSNLTVNIGRLTSFDGVGICVAPASLMGASLQRGRR